MDKRRRFLAALIAFTACLVLSQPTFAACTATISAGTPSNGSLDYTATSSGSCGGSSVTVYVDGSPVGSKSCGTPTCTMTGTLSTICMTTGSHTLSASAACGRYDNNNSCVGDSPGSSTTSFTVNSKPTVSLSMPDPDSTGATTVTITYDFPNTNYFAARRVRFVVDGGASYEQTFDTQSGTWSFPYSLTCLTGTHTYQAVAFACGGVSPTTYPTDPGFIATSELVTKTLNSKPTVSLTMPDPDPTGQTTVSIAYSFPNTSYFAHRRVRFLVDGGNAGEQTFDTQSGTWTFPYSLTCKTGTHTYQAVGLACGGVSPTTYPSDPAFIGYSNVETKQVSSKPVVNIDYSDPDNDGAGIATISYNFPNTNYFAARRIRLTWNGGVLTERTFDTPSGSFTWNVGVTCATGTYTLAATAWACGGVSPTWYPTDPAFITQVSIDIPTSHKPTASVAVDLSTSPPVADVTYSFPRTNSSSQRLLQLIWAEDGSLVGQIQPSTVSGVWHVTLPACAAGSSHQTLLVHAVACGDETADSSTPVMLPDCDLSCSRTCPSCVGSPIRVTNGNMRMSDRDPLPGAPIAPLQRTYDSRSTTIGVMGRGWTSVFDASLRSQGGSDGRKYVSLNSESNDHVIFVRSGSTYTQVFPSGDPNPGVLTYDGASGTYSYREGGRSMVRVFRASDGKLITLRSLAGQYEVRITYAGGVPTRVEDSRGDWAWTVTMGTAGTIDTIAVDGQANLIWTYGYDSNSNLTTVAVGGTTWRTYAYGSSGMTEAYDGSAHLIEAHTYDGNGNAISSGASTNDITSIQFAASGARVPGETVTHVTYATGRSADYYSRFVGGNMRTVEVKGSCGCGADEGVYAFDSQGHVVREQNASGYVVLSQFDAASGRLVSTTSALRPSTCDPATASDRCRQDPTSLQTVDLVATSATVTTTYTYADPNWPDQATTVVTPSVVGGQQRTESRSFNPLSGELATSTASGWSPDQQPQQVSRTTSVAFYGDAPQHDLTPAFDPGGSFVSTWLSLPQPAGLRKSVDGPRTDVSDVTQYVYYPIDSSVPTTLRGMVAAVKDAAGQVTRFESYDVFGNATRVVDPNGVATESTVDAMGRLLTRTIKGVAGCDTTADPLCATDLTTTRTYAPGGPVESEQTPNGNVTAYTYDDRARLATVSRGPSLSDLRERMAYTYDPATGKRSLEQTLANQSGSWTETRREAYAYDSLSRLSATTHADNTSIGYTYDPENRLASVRDENHVAPNTLYAYDPAGRLLTVAQTLSGAPGGQITTHYAYDVAGNLTAVTDPNGNTTTYSYDDLGRLETQVSPATGTTTYAYDTADNVVSTTDANGSTTVRTYDAANRVLTAVSTRDGNSEEVTWQYDDPTVGAYGLGRVASLTTIGSGPDSQASLRTRRPSRKRMTISGSSDTSHAYKYDRRGLLIEDDVQIWGDAAVQSYAYDEDGNRTTIGYPSGRLVNYTFDFAGRATGATGHMGGSSTQYVGAATYLPFGPLRSLTLGNGTAETRTFDSRYLPSAAQLAFGATTLASYTYNHDSAGNITQLTDAIDSGYGRTFAYDDLSRLVTANSASLWGNGSYSYDAMGNVTSAAIGSRTRTFTYAGTTPRIAAVTESGVATQMQYDAAGNELNGPTRGTPNDGDVRSYSPRNLLAQIDVSTPYCLGTWQGEGCPSWGSRTVTTGNLYDARGVRSASTTFASLFGTNASTTEYFYTPELNALSMGLVSDGTLTDMIWFAGRPVAAEIAGESSARFTFTDHLGTPILQTDSSGAVAWRAEYEPYGSIWLLRAGIPTDQPLRLPGQMSAFSNNLGDEESYNIFRWYRGGWGRYTQADPIGLDASINLYAYVDDSPLRYTDRLGKNKVRNQSCVSIYVKPEDPPGAQPILVPPGGVAEADGFYNGNPEQRTCIFFCDAGPKDIVRKINDVTDVVITGGCGGSCLKWSYSGPISASADKLDPRTGWKGDDFFKKHHDWVKPPVCCPK